MGLPMTSNPSNIQQILVHLPSARDSAKCSVRKHFYCKSKSSSNQHPSFFILHSSAEHAPVTTYRTHPGHTLLLILPGQSKSFSLLH